MSPKLRQSQSERSEESPEWVNDPLVAARRERFLAKRRKQKERPQKPPDNSHADFLKKEQERTPEMDQNLKVLLEVSGINAEDSPWGDAFQQIRDTESPAMALYCLYVVMGYPELHAYRTVFDSLTTTIPSDFKSRSIPCISSLLVRFMPSRTRLLMNMNTLIEDRRVDANVRGNMMQFMAKYLLDDPASQQAPAAVSGDNDLQSLIQNGILKRGGVLLIPPEGQTVEQLAPMQEKVKVVDGG